MKFKFSLICVMLILVLSIGAVSATDISDENDLNSDIYSSSSIDLAVENDEFDYVLDENMDTNDSSSSQVLGVSEDNDLIGDSSEELDFTKLNELIADDNVINLEADVILADGESSTFTSGIAINKDVTINGNNHIINGTNLVRIFNIANNANVILKDLIIAGGYINNAHGGAIYLGTGSLTVENCTFVDNAAVNSNQMDYRGNNEACGGAIYANTGTTVNIKDSLFKNNIISAANAPLRSSFKTTQRGAAIYANNYVTLSVTNSTFSDNKATRDSYDYRDMYGGAISSIGANSINTIVNSTFINNTASTGISAINVRVADITGCIFKDNTVSNDYPAIYYESNGKGTASYNVFLDSGTQIRLRNNFVNVVEEYNWYATNEPGNVVRNENTYAEPNKFIMMDVYNDGNVVKAGFIKDSNRENIPNIKLLPVREAIFEGDVDITKLNMVNGLATVNYNSPITSESEINVTIDGYTLNYTLKEGKIVSSDVILVKNTTAGSNGVIIIQFNGDKGAVDGTASVLINDTEFTVDVVNGLIFFEVGEEFDAGIYDISYEYLGGSNYVATLERIKDESKFKVDKLDVVISYSNEYNDITFNVSNNVITPTGTIDVTLGEITETLTLSDGVANYNFGLDINERGNYELKVVYSGDTNHKNATFTDTFEIIKSPVSITFENVPELVIKDIGQTIEFNLNITCEGKYINEGSFSVYENANGIYCYYEYENNEWSLNIYTWDITDAGNHELTLVYNGDGYYTPANITFKLISLPTVVAKATVSDNINVEVKVSNREYYDYLNYDSYSPISDAAGKFTIICNDKTLGEGNIENGVASISLDLLEPGSYDLIVAYEGDDNYGASNRTVSIKILDKGNSQWTVPGFDNKNSGNPDYVRSEGISILWNATVDSTISSPVIDGNGNVYVGGNSIIRIFSSNGTLITYKDTGSFDSGGGALSLFDDYYLIYVRPWTNIFGFEIKNNLNRISAYDNQIQFYTNTRYAPIMYDGKIYLSVYFSNGGMPNQGKYITRISIDDLTNQFVYENLVVNSQPIASPVIDNEGILWVTTVNGLYAVNTASFNVILSNPDLGIAGRPVIDNSNIVYTFGKNNTIYALNAETILWNVTVTGGYSSALAIDNENGYLYTVSKNGKLYKYDTNNNGAESEVYDLASNATSIIIDGNSTVYIGTQNGNVTAISADGKLLWTINLGSSLSGQMAMSSEGTIYAVADNILFALGSKTDLTINTTVDYDNSKVIIKAILGDNTTGSVIFTIDGNVSEAIAVEGNVATFEIPFKAGTHTILANFTGGSYYASVNANSEITLEKLDVEFENVPEEITMEDYTSFTFNLIQNTTTIVADPNNFKFYINGKDLSDDYYYLSDDLDLDLWDINSGRYIIAIAFESDVYNAVNATFSLIVIPKLSANTVIVDDKISVNVNIGNIVYPYEAIPDATGKFTVVSNNKTVAEGNVNQGIGTISFDKFEPGTYNLTVIYDGDDNYMGGNVTISVFIPKTSQWAVTGYDYKNSGKTDYTRLDGVEIIWVNNETINFNSNPLRDDFGVFMPDYSVVIDSDGVIYIADGKSVYALNDDGTLKYSTGGNRNGGLSLMYDFIVLDSVTIDTMRIFDSASRANLIGYVGWSTSSRFPAAIGPDGRVYITSTYGDNMGTGNWIVVLKYEDGKFNVDTAYYQDSYTGSSRWSYDLTEVSGTPVFTDDGIMWVSTPGSIGAAYISNGNVVLSSMIGVSGRPVVDDANILYYLGVDNKLYAVTLEGYVWNTTVTGTVGTTLAVGDDYLYAVNGEGVLYKYALNNGVESLVADLGSAGQSIIIDGNNNVYVSTANGDVYAFDNDDAQLWTINLGSSIIGKLAMNKNGVIYAYTADALYALGYSTDLEISSENLTVFDDEIITVNVPEGITGNITFTIGDDSYEIPIEGTTATLNLGKLPAGIYTVIASYAGSNTFASASINTTFEIIKVNAEITEDVAANVIETTVTLTFPADATGYVFIDVDGVGYYTTVKDGKAVITIPQLKSGNYTAEVNYLGDENYNAASFEVPVSVPEEEIPEPKDAGLKVSVTNTTITATLDNAATGYIFADVNGIGYYAPVKNGKATINVIGLDAGNYTVTVSYSGDDNYAAAKANALISVPEKDAPSQNVTPVEPVDPKADIKVTNKTVDVALPADAGGFVIVDVDGKAYYAPVKDGKVAIDLPELEAGNHTASIIYTGDSKYQSTTATEIISIEKALETIVSSDLIKIERGSQRFGANFTDAKGNPLVGKNVTFEVSGVTYTRTTNNNGRATIPMNLVPGNYTVKITNPETGEVKTNNITILSRIVETHDVEMFYRNGSQYIVRVLDDNGNPVGANESVNFNINGITYDRKTNKDGYARINLGLAPGDYVVTAEYKGCKASNNIKVKHVLSAVDLTKKFGASDQFKVNLVDGQGKALAGAKVSFNINGVMYERTTNADGVAKMNIKLQAGEYIITSTYNGASISNKVTVTA